MVNGGKRVKVILLHFSDTMPSDKMSEIDNHLRSSVRELIDLQSETVINLFFVYSSKNVPTLENEGKIVHPGTIIEDLRKHTNLKMYVDSHNLLNLFSNGLNF